MVRTDPDGQGGEGTVFQALTQTGTIYDFTAGHLAVNVNVPERSDERYSNYGARGRNNGAPAENWDGGFSWWELPDVARTGPLLGSTVATLALGNWQALRPGAPLYLVGDANRALDLGTASIVAGTFLGIRTQVSILGDGTYPAHKLPVALWIQGPPMVYAGDSGAAVVTCQGQVVGLLTGAGPDATGQAEWLYATPIDPNGWPAATPGG